MRAILLVSRWSRSSVIQPSYRTYTAWRQYRSSSAATVLRQDTVVSFSNDVERLIEHIEPIQKPLASTVTNGINAVFLCSKSLTNHLQNTFINDVLRRLLCLYSHESPLEVTLYVAVVDSIPSHDRIKSVVYPPRVHGLSFRLEDRENTAILAQDDPVTAGLDYVRPSLKVTMPFTLQDTQTSAQYDIDIPLATTLFENGKETTMYSSRWRYHSSGNLELVGKAQTPLRNLSIPLLSRMEDHSLDLRITAPFLPLTPPRQIISSFGNVVRQLAGSSDSEVLPASQEITAVIEHTRKLLDDLNCSQGPLDIFAIVSSPDVYQTLALEEDCIFSENGMESSRHRWINSTKKQSLVVNDITHLIQKGARFHRVLSGGGQWGKSANLINVDPKIPEPTTSELDDNAQEIEFKLPTVVPEGHFIQFVLATPPQILETPIKNRYRLKPSRTEGHNFSTSVFGLLTETDSVLGSADAVVSKPSYDSTDEKLSAESLDMIPSNMQCPWFGALSAGPLTVRVNHEAGGSKEPLIGSVIALPGATIHFHQWTEAAPSLQINQEMWPKNQKKRKRSAFRIRKSPTGRKWNDENDIKLKSELSAENRVSSVNLQGVAISEPVARQDGLQGKSSYSASSSSQLRIKKYEVDASPSDRPALANKRSKPSSSRVSVSKPHRNEKTVRKQRRVRPLIREHAVSSIRETREIIDVRRIASENDVHIRQYLKNDETDSKTVPGNKHEWLVRQLRLDPNRSLVSQAPKLLSILEKSPSSLRSIARKELAISLVAGDTKTTSTQRQLRDRRKAAIRDAVMGILRDQDTTAIHEIGKDSESINVSERDPSQSAEQQDAGPISTQRSPTAPREVTASQPSVQLARSNDTQGSDQKRRLHTISCLDLISDRLLTRAWLRPGITANTLTNTILWRAEISRLLSSYAGIKQTQSADTYSQSPVNGNRGSMQRQNQGVRIRKLRRRPRSVLVRKDTGPNWKSLIRKSWVFPEDDEFKIKLQTKHGQDLKLTRRRYYDVHNQDDDLDDINIQARPARMQHGSVEKEPRFITHRHEGISASEKLDMETWEARDRLVKNVEDNPPKFRIFKEESKLFIRSSHDNPDHPSHFRDRIKEFDHKKGIISAALDNHIKKRSNKPVRDELRPLRQEFKSVKMGISSSLKVDRDLQVTESINLHLKEPLKTTGSLDGDLKSSRDYVDALLRRFGISKDEIRQDSS